MPYDKELDRLDRENNNLRNKIEEQRKRIVYLEGATNHATGTPLSKAEARVAELERAIESWRQEEILWIEREKSLNAGIANLIVERNKLAQVIRNL